MPSSASFLEKKIVKDPGRALRRPTDKVTVFDNKLKNQVQRMSFLMHQCEGIGLAANQIGLKNSVFVYVHEGKNYACINPRYTEWPVQEAKEENLSTTDEETESAEKEVVCETYCAPEYKMGSSLPRSTNPGCKNCGHRSSSHRKASGIEGCLSIPKKWLYVPRFKRIKVSYQNLAGNALEREIEGYEARLFQHECDHLEGKLIIDYGE